MLRTRLFVSLLPFVIIVLAMGVYAIALFERLADSVDLTVTHRYQTILASHGMSQALAGLDREIRSATAQRNPDPQLVAESRKRFEENLALQRRNAVMSREREWNEQLLTNYHAYIKQIEFESDNALRSPKDRVPAVQRPAPSTAAMNAILERIREMNYRAVLETSSSIQESTRDMTRLMIIGIIIVLAIAIYTCIQLSRSIVRPVQLLTRATRELGEGKAAHPVPVVTRDELGHLAIAFNKMAAQLEEYRQSTSEQIVRLHRTMETTLASFPDPIFVLDRDGAIELRNPAAEDFANALQLGAGLPAPLLDIVRKALDSGGNFLPHSFDEAVCFHIHNLEKFLLPRVLVMRDKNNDLCGVAVVLQDVTRFRLLDSAKTNLVATVSHELNTPLTSVRMALHLLLEQTVGSLTHKQEDLLQTARNDTERLLRILNDLLDLARLEEGNAGLRREKVTPMDLLRGVIEESADKVASRGLKLNCTIEPDLPELYVDRQRIGHVFTNLIANAIKHSPPAGQILLAATQDEDNSVSISVTDQGPGIPEEYHARIFERFFRVPDQVKTGAGLGLSIAREITVAHGGHIGFRSSPGHGSTFFVVLKGDGNGH